MICGLFEFLFGGGEVCYPDVWYVRLKKLSMVEAVNWEDGMNR